MKRDEKEKVFKKMEKNRKEIRKSEVKKRGLFGSFVKGKQNKKSDIDIFIEFDEPDFEKYAETLILLENLLKRKINLIIESDLRSKLKYVKEEAEYVKL